MPEFIHGPALAEAFYFEATRPILDAHSPALKDHSGSINQLADSNGIRSRGELFHALGALYE